MSFEQRFVDIRSIGTRMSVGVDLATRLSGGLRAWKGVGLVMMALIWAAPELSGQFFNFPVQPVGRMVCVYSAVPNQDNAVRAVFTVSKDSLLKAETKWKKAQAKRKAAKKPS
ncbi:MAG: hypothetical protein O2968_02905 [Acidobacteria bacterium]|nr:hypothetical protein [Acidobacteriota bacterium]